MKTRAFFSAFLFVAACGGDPAAEAPVDVVSSRSLTGVDAPVGVTVDPSTGEVFVLDRGAGLLRLGAAGQEVVMSAAALGNQAFTDVVALGQGRFAMTVPNDGLLLDLNQQSLETFFCYLPGDIIEEFPNGAVEQLTDSLAYDPVREEMVAQPRTFVTEAGERRVERAEVGFFDAVQGGEGYNWISVDRELLAGGIAFAGSDAILLATDGRILRLDRSSGEMTTFADLSPLGIGVVDGLSPQADGTHLVLSGSTLYTLRTN